PPPPPPLLLARPMLEAPRLLLERAALPLKPPDPPPKPPRSEKPLPTLRLPTRSPPPIPPAPPVAGRLPTPPRFPAAGRLPSPPPALPRLPFWRAICCWAPFCRLASESPLAFEPNRLAVARFEYGVPPRCCELCCHRLPAVRLRFALRL